MATHEFAPDSLLFVDPDEVVHDTIDGETIVVALGTGTYYTITGAGVDMWALAATGSRYADAVAFLEGRFPSHKNEVGTAFFSWLTEFVDEGLVQVRTDTAPSTSALEAPEPTTYIPAELVRYTDMQSLLLLDPIHEADVDSGWPNAR